jgi:cyclophilin family peptidyl-prolyl cis-trans isomerase
MSKKKNKRTNKNWWRISGIAAVLLLSAVAISCAPTEPATPTATATPPAPTIPPTPTKPAMPAPAGRADMYSKPPEMQIDSGKSYVATISTAKGDIIVQLDASAAPLTVNNFVFLARQGFYDKLTFHRVEPGFVIQGGDPTGTGAGGPGYTVPAEIQLPHIEGAIATARQGDQVNPTRASSGSQFYITLAPTPFLDGGYTAFGHVIEGMDVVQSIAIGDVIEKISITEK